MINNDLKKYIEKNIFHLYDNVDQGHNLKNHILPVIRDSLDLALRLKLENINLNVVYAVAAYHDIGLLNGRTNHHTASKEFVLNDNNLRRWFNEEEIRIIADAVLEHRASGKDMPSSVYGKIIADADKSISLREILVRTHLGIKAKYPNEDLSTFEKEFDKAYKWIIEKDGEKGYLTFYLDNDKQNKLNELHNLVKDKDYIKEEYYKIYELGD